MPGVGNGGQGVDASVSAVACDRVWHIGVAFRARGYAMLSVADMDGMAWLVLREARHNWFTLIPSRYVKTVLLAALWVFGHMPCTLDL